MAKVQDLIAKCKDEEMFTQNLDENIIEAQVKGRKAYVKFLTDPQLVKNYVLDNDERKIGIVIWFPKDFFER